MCELIYFVINVGQIAFRMLPAVCHNSTSRSLIRMLTEISSDVARTFSVFEVRNIRVSVVHRILQAQLMATTQCCLFVKYIFRLRSGAVREGLCTSVTDSMRWRNWELFDISITDGSALIFFGCTSFPTELIGS